jgi:hypothetical protein
MIRKAILAGLMTAAFALPAAAQSYYIVQDTSTKHCQVVDKQPVTTEQTIVGPDGVVYKTQTEAMDAMKTVKICTSD